MARRKSARLSKPVPVVEEVATDQTTEQPEQHVTIFKEDFGGFSAPTGDGRDLLSTLPAETLNQILSHCVATHEPDKAVEIEAGTYKPVPHPFYTLASMSRHFKVHVEDFCLRFLRKHKEMTLFKSDEEVAVAEAEKTKDWRRSARIKTKPVKPEKDARVYRMELIRWMRLHCFFCKARYCKPAVFMNGICCCSACDKKEWPDRMTLTDALHAYDLRDYMLLKSRKPGPRAKQIDLPTIPYASLKVGSFYGAVMSHQCLRKDVMVLAKLVHGDVVAHMTAKYKRLADQRQKRAEKKYQQRMDARKAEQIAYLQKHLAAATTDEERSWVQERIRNVEDEVARMLYGDEYYSGYGSDDSGDSGWSGW